MDSGEVIVAIAGMLTGLAAVGGMMWGLVQYARMRRQGGPANPQLEGEVASLRDQMDSMQHQLAETQERLDFAERLLAQGREGTRLPK
jgi:hypothetical protein